MKTQLFQNENRTTDNRMTQFAFPAPTARYVSLAGDFNDWDTKAAPMHRAPDGVWHLGVALKPGRYEYRFFADEVWCNDPAAQEKGGEFDGHRELRTDRLKDWAVKRHRAGESPPVYLCVAGGLNGSSNEKNQVFPTWRLEESKL